VIDPRLDDVFALADAERLPMMVHAGQGVPEMADHAHQRSTEHPQARIILAHCGAGVFDAIWPRIEEYPNLLFDTSWWNPSTVAGLLRLVPPRHILFASDIPFASVSQQMVQTMRLALQVGRTHDQVRGIMGGQARRLLAREELLDLGPPPPPGEPIPPGMERMYAGLIAVSERMLGGQDPGQEFAFAVGRMHGRRRRPGRRAPSGDRTAARPGAGARGSRPAARPTHAGLRPRADRRDRGADAGGRAARRLLGGGAGAHP
jgi:uncharacterized protein